MPPVIAVFTGAAGWSHQLSIQEAFAALVDVIEHFETDDFSLQEDANDDDEIDDEMDGTGC